MRHDGLAIVARTGKKGITCTRVLLGGIASGLDCIVLQIAV
jgi:hypothetical protein